MANNASAFNESARMTAPSLLITRPTASAENFVARLNEGACARAKTVISPLIQIVPTGIQPDLGAYAGFIFTSSNAVALAPLGEGRKAFCVGHITAKSAQVAGWEVVATEEIADALVAGMEDITTGRLAHLAGRHRRGDIAERLGAQGKDVDVYTLYEQQLLPLSSDAQSILNGEAPVIVPLFSPRTAAHFMNQAANLDRVIVVAMSDAVAAACKGIKRRNLVIVSAPNRDEMLRAVEKHCATTACLEGRTDAG